MGQIQLAEVYFGLHSFFSFLKIYQTPSHPNPPDFYFSQKVDYLAILGLCCQKACHQLELSSALFRQGFCSPVVHFPALPCIMTALVYSTFQGSEALQFEVSALKRKIPNTSWSSPGIHSATAIVILMESMREPLTVMGCIMPPQIHTLKS